MTIPKGTAIVVFAIALLAVATACGGYGGDDNKSDEGGSVTIAGTATDSHGTKDVSGETEKVEIELYDNYFEPTVLKGTPGQKVELELKNEGNAAHTFTISEQSVDAEIQPGDETETDVTFPESGELKFICRFHEGSGMIGALEAG
jgi:plastocyanin